MKENSETHKDVVHISFEIGILLKGIHGLIEIVSGALLLLLNPYRLNWLTDLLTHHELSEDPKDLVANFLLTLSSNFSITTQHFAEFYLISHGIIKCILVLLLWQKKLWAYPLTIVSLILFIAYQVYRYTLTQSLFLILLTLFDAVMIALTYMEYRRLSITFKEQK